MPPLSKIDLWISEQSDANPEIRTDLIDYARKVRRNGPKVLGWLLEKGCPTSESSVNRWLNANVPRGQIAIDFNIGTEAYSGIEVVPALERCVVLAMNLLERYGDVIEDHPDLPVENLITAVPALMREIRCLVGQIAELEQRDDNNSMALGTAARLREIVMGDPTVKDKPEEPWLGRLIDTAMLRIQEEVK